MTSKECGANPWRASQYRVLTRAAELVRESSQMSGAQQDFIFDSMRNNCRVNFTPQLKIQQIMDTLIDVNGPRLAPGIGQQPVFSSRTTSVPVRRKEFLSSSPRGGDMDWMFMHPRPKSAIPYHSRQGSMSAAVLDSRASSPAATPRINLDSQHLIHDDHLGTRVNNVKSSYETHRLAEIANIRSSNFKFEGATQLRQRRKASVQKLLGATRVALDKHPELLALQNEQHIDDIHREMIGSKGFHNRLHSRLAKDRLLRSRGING